MPFRPQHTAILAAHRIKRAVKVILLTNNGGMWSFKISLVAWEQREGIAGVAPIATVGRVPVEEEKCPAAQGSRAEDRKRSHP